MVLKRLQIWYFLKARWIINAAVWTLSLSLPYLCSSSFTSLYDEESSSSLLVLTPTALPLERSFCLSEWWLATRFLLTLNAANEFDLLLRNLLLLLFVLNPTSPYLSWADKRDGIQDGASLVLGLPRQSNVDVEDLTIGNCPSSLATPEALVDWWLEPFSKPLKLPLVGCLNGVAVMLAKLEFDVTMFVVVVAFDVVAKFVVRQLLLGLLESTFDDLKWFGALEFVVNVDAVVLVLAVVVTPPFWLVSTSFSSWRSLKAEPGWVSIVDELLWWWWLEYLVIVVHVQCCSCFC